MKSEDRELEPRDIEDTALWERDGDSEERRLAALHTVLDATVEFLNVDEMEVLVEVAQGLVRGQKVYGYMDLDNDDRNSVSEGCDELRDCLVYVAAALRKLRRQV